MFKKILSIFTSLSLILTLLAPLGLVVSAQSGATETEILMGGEVLLENEPQKYLYTVSSLDEIPALSCNFDSSEYSAAIVQPERQNGYTGTVTLTSLSDGSETVYTVNVYDQNTFQSHFINLGGDPWVTYHDGWYYYMYTGNGFYISRSRDLSRVNSNPVAVFTISQLVDNENLSIVKELWAPELHFVDGRWYIYFTAYDGEAEDSTAWNGCTGTPSNHRMYVLESENEDAFSTYTFKGQIKELEADYIEDDGWKNAEYNIKDGHWAIDQSIFKWNGKLYAVWSGWSGYKSVDQRIYIAEMSNPYTISSARVELSRPEYAYETYSVIPAVNEAPQALISPDGNTLNIAFSVNRFDDATYSLGLLTLTENGDPLNAEDWTKTDKPVFETNLDSSTYSVGHCSFVPSPDGSDYYAVYHARRGADTDTNPREIRTQQFYWNTDGTPCFDKAINATTPVQIPSGTAIIDMSSLEAENGMLSAEAIIPPHDDLDVVTYDDDYYSGGKRVALKTAGAAVDFTYTAEKSGKYTLSLLANGSGVLVTVNGTEYKKAFGGYGGNVNNFCYYDITGVELQAGENTISIAYTSSYSGGAYFDRLDIWNEADAEAVIAAQDAANLVSTKTPVIREVIPDTSKLSPEYNKEYTFNDFGDFDKYWFSSEPFVDDPEYEDVITTCRAGGNKRLLVTGKEFSNIGDFKASVEIIPAAAHYNAHNPAIPVADETAINAGILFRIGEMYDYTTNVCSFDGYRCFLTVSDGVVKMQLSRYYFASEAATQSTNKVLKTATETLPYTPGDTYILEVKCIGNTVEATAYNANNPSNVIEIKNQTIQNAVAETIDRGKIGLFVNCVSRVTFANMKITSYDITESLTESYDEISDFVIKSNVPTAMPTATENGIVTSTGALKMQALDSAVTYTEKTFADFYNIDNYDIYGNRYNTANYEVATYGNTFDTESQIITTADNQSKLKLDGTEGMTDFETEFTVTKIGSNSLYGGISFRLQDSDFRTGSFGTQGYMLLLNSASTSKDVKIILRKYSTASVFETDTVTASSLLGTATNGVNVKITVSGQTLSVTVTDTENAESSYSAEFTLVPDSTNGNGTYYDNGSFAFVTNGNHTFESIALKGTVPTNYVTHEKPLYNLDSRDYYTLYGNTTGDDITDYNITFADNCISAYSQSKIKLNNYTNIEDFNACFDLKKTNGNALYGGIAFRIQDAFFEKATYGTPGYMLYANSAADSMDLSLILRNYSTASGFESTTVKFEGFLAAADQKNIRLEVEVIGDTLNATVYDLTDLTRKNTATFNLKHTGEKAGNFKGGSIALVSNGTHDFSNISVSELVEEAPYTKVKNFESEVDFTLPTATSVQGGIMFYVGDSINRTPGLTAFSLNAIRTANSADKSMTLQLVRYGTKIDGTVNVNLGGVTGSTKVVSNILTTADGTGDTVRLKIKVIRGTLYYSLANTATGVESDVYSIALNTTSTSSSVNYNTEYKSGGIGIFTNLADLTVSNFSVTHLPDCTVSITDYEGGTVTGDGTYAYSETITVNAEVNYGYDFGGWYDGNILVCENPEYTFTATESITLTPRFISLPFRYSGLDATNTAAVITVDSIEGVSEVGIDVTIKNETGDQSFNLSTNYVNANAENKNAFIATKDKVYYCDIDGDGSADSADLASLRKGLLTDTLNTSAADLNGDTELNIIDLIRFKKISADIALEFSNEYKGYIYAFVITDKLRDAGIQYIEITPYTVTDGQKKYTLSHYFKYDGMTLVKDSASANHTPFAKIRIACVGDSLTQGVGATGWSSGDYTYAYPEQLGEILGDSCTVANFGVGGSYAYYYEGRTASLWYPNTERYTQSTEFDADIVLLMMGTNDARAVQNEEQAEAFKAAYTELVNHYLNAEHKPIIYVMNGISMKNYDAKNLASDSTWLERDPLFTTYIQPRQLEVQKELGLNFIDTYNGTLDLMETTTDGLASDLLHPNDTGYRAIAELVANNISLDIFY